MGIVLKIMKIMKDIKKRTITMYSTRLAKNLTIAIDIASLFGYVNPLRFSWRKPQGRTLELSD